MVNVTSEIGRLRRVLIHEPGPEVDRMVPPMMEELLFDDILFGDRARDEHRRLRRRPRGGAESERCVGQTYDHHFRR